MFRLPIEASAIITGEQYCAVAAIVLVHSFSEHHTGWEDYEAFVRPLRDASASIPLFAAWVTGDCRFLKS
jgi:hypothetical protein